MKKLLLFAAAFLIWGILTGLPDFQEILAGAAVSAGAAFFFGEVFSIHPEKVFQFRRWRFFIYYIPLLIWEIIKANLDVAYRVIHPALPINPGIVKIKTNLKSEISQTMLANSITLTPGTMCVDIKGGCMYIHWIDVKSKETEEATRIIACQFEKLLKEIFE